MTDTQQLEKSLRERREALLERLRTIKSDFASGRSGDWAEQAQERENEETLTAIERESEQELAQIDTALQRMRDGRYGICDACGGPISPARLQAIPHATHCIHCAEGAADAH